MASSRIPSPARSQGTKSTPRRYNPRASRSVGSPARSNSSVKLSAMVQMDTFALSPMPTRRSVLSDITDIDVPTRRSWWKKLDENSREVMEVLNTKGPLEVNNAIEEYIEIDVLSQEKEKNYTLDLPESSESESINSIVIPQRKLFTQKESKAQNKFAQIIDNRESLAKLNKTQIDDEKVMNVGRKTLFNHGTKQKTKPLFPSALLNISPDKTIANKTKELASTSAKGQVRSLFGNRGGAKRKNMFADFIVSESEDEIPEIQPKVFGFQKKAEQKRQQSLKSRKTREPHLVSPISSITDIEIDDWRLLPSSTMVDHQLEDGLRTTPSKRARLSKLTEAIESISTETNTISNKSKMSNKSLHSKNKSNNLSKSKNTDVNELAIITTDSDKNNKSVNGINTTKKNTSYQHSLEKQVACEASNDLEDINIETTKNHKYNKSKSLKTLSRIDQALQSDDDDDEDFTLVYENNDQKVIENEPNKPMAENEAQNLINPTATKHSVRQSATNRLQNKSESQNVINQNEISKDNDEIDITDVREVPEFGLAETVDHSNRNKSQLKKSYNQKNYSHREEMREQNLCSADEDEEKAHQNVSPEKDKKVEEEVEQNMEKIFQCYNEKEYIELEEVHDREEEEIDNQTNEEKQENRCSAEMEVCNKYQEKEDDNSTENEEGENHDTQASEEQTEDGSSNIDKEQVEDEKNESQDEVDNEIVSYERKDNENPDKFHAAEGTANNVKVKAGNVSTDRHKERHEAKDSSPEVCRKHNKTSQMESFTVGGRNTSVRKTKSNIKNLTLRPSLAPARESMGHSDGSRNSSAEGSGWDSHRTTRATLRQTFGRDFTPRKSLRALVMEKSAKRQTNLTEVNAEISRFPQANSTELPISFDPEEGNVAEKMSEFGQKVSRNVYNSYPAHKISDIGENQQQNKFKDTQKFNASDHEASFNAEKISVFDSAHKIHESNKEGSVELEINESGHEVSRDIDDAREINESYDAQEMKECNKELSLDVDDDQEMNESDDAQEMNESDHEESRDVNDTPKTNQSDDAQKVNESDDAKNMNESDHEVSLDGYNAQEMNESDDAQEMNEPDNEMNEPDHEVSHHVDDGPEMNESDDLQEIHESDHEVSLDVDDAQEMNESDDAQEMNEPDHEVSLDVDDAQEMNESDDAQEMNEPDHEVSHNVDDGPEMNESDQEVSYDINNADDTHESNDSHNAQEFVESDQEVPSDDDAGEEHKIDKASEVQEMDEFEDAPEINESYREDSRKTRQTSLEMYLQTVKNRKLERKKQLVGEIMNTLKPPTRDMLNPFKVPAIPKLRRTKAQQIKPTAKPLKPSVISLGMLPPEILEDMKYKPPKRYRPTNASWITKRLYKFLEKKLEPKYDYKARVRSEKLVETIYNFTKDIRRHDTAPSEAVDALKLEMARLDVVKTHFEFYEFFHEYMPREVRVKVVPDLFNKISLPRRGVFADILR